MSCPFTPDLRDTIHASLARFQRIGSESTDAALKHAAVVIAICPAAPDSCEAAFLLTRRASTLRGHAGQWALPGGRCDPGESVSHAALRELQEELGLQLGEVDLLGQLDDYATRSGYRISPVVAWCANADAIVPNTAEVASVHRVPLAAIARPDAVSFITIAESTRRVVRLRLFDSFIHAPTAAMLYQFGELLCGRITRVADLEQPVFAWR